jgi:hypothetical protein
MTRLATKDEDFGRKLSSFIFFVDFFFKVFIIDARLKQSEGQIPFCLTLERRFVYEKNSIFTHRSGFSSRLFC